MTVYYNIVTEDGRFLATRDTLEEAEKTKLEFLNRWPKGVRIVKMTPDVDRSDLAR